MRRWFCSLLFLSTAVVASNVDPCGDHNEKLGSIRAVPYQDTQGKAFKVLRVDRDGFWDKLGAKPGDVIIEMDGTAVSDPLFNVVDAICGPLNRVVVKRGKKKIVLLQTTQEAKSRKFPEK